MLDFFRRLPELLRLKRKPSGGTPPRLRVVEPSGARETQAQRGRGTGRGITPPTPPKPKKNRPNRRGRK